MRSGQDKDPEGHKEEDPNRKVESKEKQSGRTALAVTQAAKKEYKGRTTKQHS